MAAQLDEHDILELIPSLDTRGRVYQKHNPDNELMEFHEEFMFPTLLPAIEELLGTLEAKGVVDPSGAPVIPPVPFNPIRWLAEYLMRHNPRRGGVFKCDSAYARQLARIGKIREEQRMERERVAAARRKAEAERVRKEREEAERSRIMTEVENRAKEQAKTRVLQQQRLAKRNGGKRDEEALKAIEQLFATTNGVEAHKAMTFELDSAMVRDIFKILCKTCINNTNARVCYGLILTDPDTLQYIIAVRPDVNDEDGMIVSDAPLDDWILTRGEGRTFYVVDELQPLHIEDVFANVDGEELYWFGEKHPGQFAAVPILLPGGNRALGALILDTVGDLPVIPIRPDEVQYAATVASLLTEALKPHDERHVPDHISKVATVDRIKAREQQQLVLLEEMNRAALAARMSLQTLLKAADKERDEEKISKEREGIEFVHPDPSTVGERIAAQQAKMMLKIEEMLSRLRNELDMLSKDSVGDSSRLYEAVVSAAIANTRASHAHIARYRTHDSLEVVSSGQANAAEVGADRQSLLIRWLQPRGSIRTKDTDELTFACVQDCIVRGDNVCVVPKLNGGIAANKASFTSKDSGGMAVFVCLRTSAITEPFAVLIADTVASGELLLDEPDIYILRMIGEMLGKFIADVEARRRMTLAADTMVQDLAQKAHTTKPLYFGYFNYNGKQLIGATDQPMLGVRSGQPLPEMMEEEMQTVAVVLDEDQTVGVIGADRSEVNESSREANGDEDNLWEQMKMSAAVFGDVARWVLQDPPKYLVRQGTQAAALDLDKDYLLAEFKDQMDNRMSFVNLMIVKATANIQQEITARHLDDLKALKKPSIIVHRTMKGVLYLLGRKPSEVAHWEALQLMINETLITKIATASFDSPKRRVKYIRAARAIKGISFRTAMRKGSNITALFYLWVLAVVQKRNLYDHILSKAQTAALALSGDSSDDSLKKLIEAAAAKPKKSQSVDEDSEQTEQVESSDDDEGEGPEELDNGDNEDAFDQLLPTTITTAI